MTVQTSVTVRPDLGVPGQIADPSTHVDVVGGVAGEALDFGVLAVDKGAGWIIPTGEGDITGFPCGVVVRGKTLATQTGYVAGESISILRRGRIFVKADAAMSLGDTVCVTETTGVFTGTSAATTVDFESSRVSDAGTVPSIDFDPATASLGS